MPDPNFSAVIESVAMDRSRSPKEHNTIYVTAIALAAWVEHNIIDDATWTEWIDFAHRVQDIVTREPDARFCLYDFLDGLVHDCPGGTWKNIEDPEILKTMAFRAAENARIRYEI